MGEKIFYKYKSCSGAIGSTGTAYAYLLDSLKINKIQQTKSSLVLKIRGIQNVIQQNQTHIFVIF